MNGSWTNRGPNWEPGFTGSLAVPKTAESASGNWPQPNHWGVYPEDLAERLDYGVVGNLARISVLQLGPDQWSPGG